MTFILKKIINSKNSHKRKKLNEKNKSLLKSKIASG